MFSKCFFTLVFCLVFLINPLLAQNSTKELPSGYLMTVAAYLASGEDYAIRYTKKLRSLGHDAEYGFTYKKNMYFVYIKQYADFKIAISEINSTRKNTPFNDTWVYAYVADNPMAAEPTPKAEPTVTAQEQSNRVEPQAKETSSTSDPVIEAEQEEPLVVLDSGSTVAETAPPEVVIPEGSRLIYFETVDARTHQHVDIEFSMFNPSNNRVISTLHSREVKRISPPFNQDHNVHVTINTFGWIKDEINFNFNEPVTDSTNHFARLLGDTLVLFFDMHRMHTGDVQALYNVYFFNESAIMLSQSEFQLAELLSMLEENKGYRIKLHGHTNGSASGTYSRLADNDTVFFKMSPQHEQTSGSAKDLSFDRANTVRQYLIAQGVTEDRIEVKGWGGKKMIHDENSKAARRNIRVEVEIIAED